MPSFFRVGVEFPHCASFVQTVWEKCGACHHAGRPRVQSEGSDGCREGRHAVAHVAAAIDHHCRGVRLWRRWRRCTEPHLPRIPKPLDQAALVAAIEEAMRVQGDMRSALTLRTTRA
jgi:hypothetical protein